jgi:CheY-like chemotaxis protein
MFEAVHPYRQTPAQAGRTRHILCVDADDESRLLAAELLYEHEVDFALTGDDAVQLAQSRSYDLLLVDPNVPGCEPASLLEDLRLYGGFVPLILTSVDDTRAGSRQAEAADLLLPKRLHVAELRTLVTRLLGAQDGA